MEIVLNTQNDCLIFRDPFDLVAPFPGDLDTGLNRFRTGTHGKNHVETKELGHELGKFGEHIIVKRTRTQGQPRRLVHQSLDELRMAVALIDSGIRGQEI